MVNWWSSPTEFIGWDITIQVNRCRLTATPCAQKSGQGCSITAPALYMAAITSDARTAASASSPPLCLLSPGLLPSSSSKWADAACGWLDIVGSCTPEMPLISALESCGQDQGRTLKPLGPTSAHVSACDGQRGRQVCAVAVGLSRVWDGKTAQGEESS